MHHKKNQRAIILNCQSKTNAFLPLGHLRAHHPRLLALCQALDSDRFETHTKPCSSVCLWLGKGHSDCSTNTLARPATPASSFDATCRTKAQILSHPTVWSLKLKAHQQLSRLLPMHCWQQVRTKQSKPGTHEYIS